MSRTGAILTTLVLYKLAMIVIGVLASRMTRDEGDYLLGGRGLGPVVAALSASASSSSVWTLLGVSGFAYASGLAAVWLIPACVGGFALNWYVLAPALRRAASEQGALTVTQLLAGPPRAGGGQGARRAIVVLASAIVLASLLTYVAAQFQGAGRAFAETFQMGEPSAVALGAGIVVFYTLLGGFWAVSLTDTLQGLMMAVAALCLPLVALAEVGPGEMLAAALEPGGGSAWVAATKGLPLAGALGFVFGLLGIGLGYPGQPHVVNRLMALDGERSVTRGRRIAIAWALLIYSGMIVLGWCMKALAPGIENPEDAFVRATELLLDPVPAGIMLAALISAIMSTADSQLLVAAGTVSHDLIGDAGGRAEDPGKALRRARLTVLVIALGAVGVALSVDATIFSSVLFAWTAMGAAFGPVLLVCVCVGRPRDAAILGAMVSGFVLSVLAHFTPALAGGSGERVLPFVVALAISWWGVGLSTRPASKAC